MHAILISTALCGIVAAAPQAGSAWSIGQPVKTTSGSIVGHASPLYPDVSEYLGIPFAEPPVGDLRWAAPKALKSAKTVTAAKFGLECPANVGSNQPQINTTSPLTVVGTIWGQAGSKFDEDCLTLNVWSKPQSGDKKKAVMVWIYGGGYNIGSSANPIYQGSRLAGEKDVVVVTVNYRLNLFGFPGAKFAEVNPGLLDQRLAVEWVRDNIEAFGGDPKRIIIFGESAGGGSVDMYAYAWTKDPIITGIIPESGSVPLTNTPGGPPDQGWFKVSKALNCGDESTGEKSLACLRKVSWQDLLKAMKTSGTSGTESGAFRPRADGKTVFTDYGKRLDEGNFIKVPYLIGMNDDEAGLTTALNTLPKSTAPNTHRKRQAKACNAHGNALGRIKQGVPAWRYLFKGVYPNTDIGSKGAYHTAEMPFIFGTTEYISKQARAIFRGFDLMLTILQKDTEVEKEMIATVMTAWTTFAKDPKNGLKEVLKWPTYDADKPTLIALGGRNSSKVEFIDQRVPGVGC